MVVNADMAKFIERSAKGHQNFFVEDPSWAEDFAPNGNSTSPYLKTYANIEAGRLVAEGEKMTRKRYAR